ncbi:MAG: hypothetical protein WCP57_07725 [Bacteroidota bacterium]
MVHVQFGFSQYLIQSYTPAELHLIDSKYSTIQELRLYQRYFQINTLKCYASYKFWQVVHKDGSIQEPDAALQKVLLPIEKNIPFQWKSFFLPILLIVLLSICWGLFFAITLHKKQNKIEKEQFRFVNEQRLLIGKNEHLKIGDVYIIQSNQYQKYCLVLDSIFQDHIYFASYDSLANLSASAYSMYDAVDYLNYLDTMKFHPKQVFDINRASLPNAIYRGDMQGAESFKGVEFPAIDATNLFKVNEIFRSAESDITISFYSEISIKNKFSIAFENNGKPCKIKSIKSTGKSVWEVDPFYFPGKSKPYEVTNTQLFFITTHLNSKKDNISFDIICEEENGTIKTYAINGTASNPMIEQY